MRKYSILFIIIISLLILTFAFIKGTRLNYNANIVSTANEPVSNKLRKVIESVSYPTQPRPVGMVSGLGWKFKCRFRARNKSNRS